MDFKLTSKYKPTGDQPEAIRELTDGVNRGDRAQVLLGVTGSGKTFTMANVIANVNRPTLILSHNKTLAAQLYDEMRGFFPDNAVEYYVSYYDYYQPEAYLPSSDTYIEKDLAINEEIDRLRLSAVSSLLSGRKDVVVVSSVSCIYGMGSPNALSENVIEIRQGQNIERNALLRKLVQSLYVRNDLALERGNFRVKGDTVDIYMAYSEKILRINFWDDEIDTIEELEPVTMLRMGRYAEYKIYPANLFMTTQEQTNKAIHDIQDDLTKQVAFFEELGDPIKAQREQERQADRARKEAERKKKQAEQEAKRTEARHAAQDEINWLHSYIDRLSALYEQIETELDNPGLTEYKKIQLQKQLLQTEEKIHKNKVKLDKAYFTANN